MSGNTLAGGQETGDDKITFRLPARHKEAYKRKVDNMSEDLGDYVARTVNDDLPDYETPRQPPQDSSELRRAYELMCELATRNGIVRHKSATRCLSGGPKNIGKDEVEYRLLHRLRKRGYIGMISDPTGQNRAWKIRGWEK